MQKIARTLTATGMLVASLAFAGAPQAASAQTGTQRDYTTGISVQNLSTSATANVTIQFFAEGSSTPSSSLPITGGIAAGKNTVVVGTQLGVTAGFRGAAIVQSDQPVAATVNIASPDAGAGFGGAAYAGFTGGSATASLPIIFKDFFNFNTFFSVQNVGTADATVNVTYRNAADGATFTQSKTIRPNTSATFNQETDTDVTPALPSNFNGNATITSNQPVVAALMQVGPTTILGYSGFATAGSTDPVFPLINKAFGFITGISLQNTGAQTTTVTISYTPSVIAGIDTGTACTETRDVGPGAITNFALQAFDGTAPAGVTTCANGNFIGAAAVTTNSANQTLVGVVNQLNNGTRKGGTYAAFNKAQGTGTVIYPIIQDRLFGFFTGVSLVNVGAAATTITCTYTGENFDTKEPVTVTQTAADVAAGGVATFPHSGAIGPSFNGSGVCSAATGGRIVGLGQQLSTTAAGDAFFVSEGINR